MQLEYLDSGGSLEQLWGIVLDSLVTMLPFHPQPEVVQLLIWLVSIAMHTLDSGIRSTLHADVVLHSSADVPALGFPCVPPCTVLRA